jgi:hypothetical protein
MFASLPESVIEPVPAGWEEPVEKVFNFDQKMRRGVGETHSYLFRLPFGISGMTSTM